MAKRKAGRTVRVTDRQWDKIAPHLPPRPAQSRGGRPWIANRDVFEGILWVLRTGARWRDLPDAYPSATTCWRRLKEWMEQEVWLNLWRAFLAELDDRGRLKWENVFIDGTFSSAKKGASRSGRPRGGRAQSSWWWQTARVYLWECPPPRRPRRK